MNTVIFKTGILTAASVVCLAGIAQAGGFSRGKADTDILFEDGAAAARAGVTFVAPQRSYETINGAASTDGRHTDSYLVPSASVMARMTDDFACAGTYTQPFGAAATYGAQAQAADAASSAIGNATIEAGFRTNEYGVTCAVRTEIDKGRFTFLGGVFLQSFDYKEVTRIGTLRLKDDSELGYRLGAAYEIPEIALRAQVLYRSQIKQDSTGDFTVSTLGAPVLSFISGSVVPAGARLAATGFGTLPQSVDISLQTGIAPGWLAFGSVRWTDWSVLPAFNYSITGLGPLVKNFRFRDGWTVTGGVGHAFNDTVSGMLSLTWDRGVSTGADVMTDSWTVGLGTAVKAGPGEFRVGGAVSYLTSGSQTFGGALADYDATAGSDLSYGANLSYLVKF